MSLSEVAKKILTTGGNLTMVAGNLEKQGLVSRKCSTEDARVYILSLTPKGKKLISRDLPRSMRRRLPRRSMLLRRKSRRSSASSAGSWKSNKRLVDDLARIPAQ